jgi:hypothetical protein
MVPAQAFSLLLAAVGVQEATQAVDTPDLAKVLETTPADGVARCRSKDPADIIVCGRPGERYRIDPNVLEAIRSAEAPPVQPPVTADSVNSDCVGPQHCGGGTIPLVGMALTAVRAAAMAAEGDDWREAFRTRLDEYRAYQDARSRQHKGGRVSLGVSAGN